MSPRTVPCGLLTALLALEPLGAQPAPAAVCNVPPRAANLDFTLENIEGNEVALGDYRGRVILLDFWATWCAPCRVEIPVLVELYEKYRDDGFVVLGVSVSDTVELLEPFVAELDMSYPVLLGARRFDVQDAFGPLVGFPTSFLISRDGTICVRHTGIATKEQFESEIEALL